MQLSALAGPLPCKTPKLNAKPFEKLIVDGIRANILTESNIRDHVKLLDEEMGGVAREQQERLEDAAADARAILSQRRAVLEDVETIAAYALDMSEFLKESELTERRAFI